MASEEPLFDPSLKKRKKKTVAFHEDPLGADADPTTPAPATIDDTTTNGVTVDMGTKTLHEQMKESGLDGVAEPAEEKKEDDDFKAMFGDIKKKKKKKDIPLDLGEEGSGTSTPTATAPAAGEDLDFSDLKKKKKTSKKKAAIDMEAFEKELNESKAKEAEEEEAPDGKHLEELDETELGEDPFARGEGAVSVEAGGEPWLGSDRDYTYLELLHRFYTQLHAANPALLTSTVYLRQRLRHLQANAQTARARHPIYVCGNGYHRFRRWFRATRYQGSFPAKADRARSASIHRRIRHLQDMQITRYTPHEGESYLLHVLRILWIETFGQPYQDRFPGTGRKEKQKQGD
ncbi:unnamed protein product [Somion occarium]|uniref:Uncharacterized protein n=1 Tax=Somion occarium TaxID=3059160 RepID=A0ABP1DQW9_9APHY